MIGNLEFIEYIPPLLIIGITVLISYYMGKFIKIFRLPSLVGFMLVGVILGHSFLNILSKPFQEDISFITEIALGFVAFSIGLELSLASLRKLGASIIWIILAESFGAFIIVTLGIYLISKNWILALVFGSMAPASAPAGTVAVIQEYKARGSLTKALYAVVGFDDGLAIIIFGFAAAAARSLLLKETSNINFSLIHSFLTPLREIIISLVVGVIGGILLCISLKKVKETSDIIIITFGFITIINGLCTILHLSLILTNMMVGFLVVNTQTYILVQKIRDALSTIMPFLFVLFFALAGANLHIHTLPSLGIIGIVYIICRTLGLISGAYLGALIGKAEEKIRKYLGLGILSQAGVAIGLALIIKQEFKGLGKVIETIGDNITVTTGDWVGASVLTTVTATCIFFEIIGPISTKIALKKAGEIKDE